LPRINRNGTKPTHANKPRSYPGMHRASNDPVKKQTKRCKYGLPGLRCLAYLADHGFVVL
jgi:hypothetical protein